MVKKRRAQGRVEATAGDGGNDVRPWQEARFVSSWEREGAIQNEPETRFKYLLTSR